MRAYVNGIEIPLGESFTEYSPEEQVVGQWIDGKPVYEKIIILPEFACPATGTYTNFLNLPMYSVDTLVCYDVFIIPSWDLNNVWMKGSWNCNFDCANGWVRVRQEITEGNVGKPLYIRTFIRYTKTTDQATIDISPVTSTATFFTQPLYEYNLMDDAYQELANGDDTPTESPSDNEEYDTPIESPSASDSVKIEEEVNE